ncbi:MAG TPA: restriction endonuclease subunit S [Kineosporiaceae bacterium]
MTAFETIFDTRSAGWDTAPLGSICDVTVGRCRPGPTPSVEDGVPVISSAQIVDGRLHLDGARRLHPGEAERHRGAGVRPGDLIMTRKASRRRHALVTSEQAQTRALVNESCFTVRVRDDGRVISEYLDHYFTHPGVQDWLDGRTHNGLVPNLTVDQLRELDVLLPPRDQQSQIVQLYRTIDEQIHTYEQIIATTRELRRGLIEPLLAGRSGGGSSR